MKILITGANGQLGTCIKATCGLDIKNNYIFLGKNELDITSQKSISDAFDEYKPTVVVNCAAFVKTDDAENSQILAYKINTMGPMLLAAECKKRGIELVHISTDYVFDGEKTTAYTAQDTCNPLNIYGITKYCGEQAILNIYPENSIIIRTSWLYSEYGENFFTKTIANIEKAKNEGMYLSYVIDQVGCPTYAMNLAEFIVRDLFLEQKDAKVLENENRIFHYTDDGIASRYDFARAILDYYYGDKPPIGLSACESSQFVDKAKRPKCCILSKRELVFKFDCRRYDWRESLKECIEAYKKRNNENSIV